jgi:hypothetical protein
MSRLVATTLVVVLAASLAACSPQWSAPVFESQTATPKWLAGLWTDSSGKEVLRFKERDSDFEVLFGNENFVFLGSALVTMQSNELFISVGLRDGRVLWSGPGRKPDRMLRLMSGYFVYYIDRVNDDEIELAPIDYEKLFARLEASKRIGTDLCQKEPLFGRTLQRPRNPPLEPEEHLLPGPELLCYLLDTNALARSGGARLLERGDNVYNYFRVKTVGSSGGNSGSAPLQPLPIDAASPP